MRLTNIVYMGMGEPLDNLEEVLKSLEILTSDWGFGMSPDESQFQPLELLLPCLNSWTKVRPIWQ